MQTQVGHRYVSIGQHALISNSCRTKKIRLSEDKRKTRRRIDNSKQILHKTSECTERSKSAFAACFYVPYSSECLTGAQNYHAIVYPIELYNRCLSDGQVLVRVPSSNIDNRNS